MQKGQYKTLAKARTQVSVQKVNLRKIKELPTKECDLTLLALTQIVTINPKRKQAINMTETQKTKKSIDSDNSVLNPELTELKKQLFAGFEQLIEQSIEPLKKDIQELKNERTPGERTLNVETLSLKLKQNDIKQ